MDAHDAEGALCKRRINGTAGGVGAWSGWRANRLRWFGGGVAGV